MSPRVAPFVALVAVVVAACSATGSGSGSAAPSFVTVPAPAAASPAATVGPSAVAAVPSARRRPTARPRPTVTPNTGNVDAPVTPELSIELQTASTIRVTLLDPSAKAWQVIVRGTGGRATNRWLLTVETSDVAPVITTTDTTRGVEAQPVEQPGLETGATTGKVCSSSLPICVRLASVRLPNGGNGTLVLSLTRTDPAVAMSVAGATARWPTDPFVLGPWTTTEAFPWDA
jgi:hypothetical protein